MKASGLNTLQLSGPEARSYIDEIADLRIRVFREYPYLYEGTHAYEKTYLERYFSCEQSFVGLVKDGEKIVGVTTAIPMRFEDDAFRAPFERAGHDVSRLSYFGESILDKAYRGRGLGKSFFDMREAYARSLGATAACFCAVERDPSDPRQPSGYRPLDAFWQSRGYEKTEITTTYDWEEVGSGKEISHPMRFWWHSLPTDDR